MRDTRASVKAKSVRSVPGKRWKFSRNDMAERQCSAARQDAYGTALGRRSNTRSLWFAAPANRKWYRNWAASQLLSETMEDMKLSYPNPPLDVPALRMSLRAVA